MAVSRRDFLKISSIVIGATGIFGLGFDYCEAQQKKEGLRLKEKRIVKSICPYCSVSCGMLIYTTMDGRNVIYIEGNPDDPVNKGSLCPKGASVKDFIVSPHRNTIPLYKRYGDDGYKEADWGWMLDRISRLVKDTRDRTFISHDSSGKTVNRCEDIVWFTGSPLGNEEGYLAIKFARSLGLTGLETQARL